MTSSKYLFSKCPFCHSEIDITKTKRVGDTNKRFFICGTFGLRDEQKYIHKCSNQLSLF